MVTGGSLTVYSEEFICVSFPFLCCIGPLEFLLLGLLMHKTQSVLA